MLISSIINNHVFLWKYAYSIKQNNINAINNFERTFLSLLITILFTGFILFHTNVNLYRAYVGEDGFIEWLTVIALFCSAAICLNEPSGSGQSEIADFYSLYF